MLMLTRRAGQEIVVPDYGIVISVVKITGRSVRIGVTAPQHVAVHRREVLEADNSAIRVSLGCPTDAMPDQSAHRDPPPFGQ